MIYTLVLLAALQASLTSAWSYNVLHGRNTATNEADFQGTKVLNQNQPCTPLQTVDNNGEVDPRVSSGLQIYQFAPQTPPRQWARPVKYIGFWGGEKCKGMPRYVVHWYDMVDTTQALLFDDIIEGSLGWGTSSVPVLGVRSWREIDNGDELWPDQIPQGSAAVMVSPESAPSELDDPYMILSNVVRMDELVSASRVTPERKDVNWEEYGTGSRQRPQTTQLTVAREGAVNQGEVDMPPPTQSRVRGQARNQVQNQAQNPIEVLDDEEEGVQFISRNQWRTNIVGQTKPLTPPLEKLLQRTGPVYNADKPALRKPMPPTSQTSANDQEKKKQEREAQKKQQLQEALNAQQEAYSNIQRKVQEQVLRQSQQQQQYNNPSQQGINSGSGPNQLPTLEDVDMSAQKMIELRAYWLGQGYSEKALVELLRKLPDSVMLELFQRTMAGKITIKQIADYLLDIYKAESQRLNKEIEEARELNRQQLARARAFDQQLLQQYAIAHTEAQRVGNQMEAMRRMLQNQGIQPGATNQFANLYANPFASAGTNSNRNMNMNMNANPNMNMNMNMGGPNQFLGNLGRQLQAYGSQQQMFGNLGNQQQMFGNFGGQQQMFGDQGGGMGQQGSVRPYQNQQPQPSSQIEVEEGTDSNTRPNPVPGVRVPPNTPLNPRPADFTAGAYDSLEYPLRLPNLFAQHPGFAQAGKLGGMQGVTRDELSELTTLLRLPGGGRRSTGVSQDNAPTGPPGGSTLSQLMAGINAGTSQQQQSGGGMEEEVEDDESASVSNGQIEEQEQP
ncbi:hypothetical protein TWF281_011672 [Arthrobotrys megalospora]